MFRILPSDEKAFSCIAGDMPLFHIYNLTNSSGTRKKEIYIETKIGVLYTLMTKELTLADNTRSKVEEEEEEEEGEEEARTKIQHLNSPLRGGFRSASICFFFSVVIVCCSHERVGLAGVAIVFGGFLRLLPLGFVRSGAFPAVRLPLFVQPADAHSLPTPHRDVLLHEAGQHAFLGQH